MIQAIQAAPDPTSLRFEDVMSSNTEAQSLLKVAKERMMQRPGKVKVVFCEVSAVCVQSHAE